MLSNLPPGVTDAMIEAQCYIDPLCEECRIVDDGSGDMDWSLCPHNGDPTVCRENAEADAADRANDYMMEDWT